MTIAETARAGIDLPYLYVYGQRKMARGNSPGCAMQPRVVQYIMLKPTRWQDRGVWL